MQFEPAITAAADPQFPDPKNATLRPLKLLFNAVEVAEVVKNDGEGEFCVDDLYEERRGALCGRKSRIFKRPLALGIMGSDSLGKGYHRVERVIAFSVISILIGFGLWISQSTDKVLRSKIESLHADQQDHRLYVENQLGEIKARQLAMESLIKAPVPVRIDARHAQELLRQSTVAQQVTAVQRPSAATKAVRKPEVAPLIGSLKKETCWPLQDQVSLVADMARITGIIRPISAFVTNVIAAAQIREGLRGSVGEFGAFQGKFTLCLLLSARKEEVANSWFVADAFERLHEFGGNPNGGVGCQSASSNRSTNGQRARLIL